MAEPQKVWNKHKITAIVIMLIAIVAVFMMFIEFDNPAINHPKSLERSISNYIFAADVQAEVVQIDKHDKYLMVTFTDKRYPNFMGIARFQRGYDLLWHPVESSYGDGVSVSTYHYYYDETWDYDESGINSYQSFKKENIIYGINVDPRISSVKGVIYNSETIYTPDADNPQIITEEIKNYQEVLYEQNITAQNFINYFSEEEFITDWRYFDAAGNDITIELKLKADDSGPEGWVSLVADKPGFGSWILNIITLLIMFIVAKTFWAGNPNPIKYSEMKEQNEKSSSGFLNKFKNLEKRKKTALSVFMITLVVAVAFHSVFYSTFNSENSLTNSIEKYTGDSNVTLVKTAAEGKHLVALYTTEKPYYKGIVAYDRGWNGLWAPVEYSTMTDICITSFGVNSGNDYYFITTGMNCDPRAVYYEYSAFNTFAGYEYVDGEYESVYKESSIVYSGNISEPNFIHMYNVSNHPVYRPKIYDSAGNDLERELTDELLKGEDITGSGYSGGTIWLIKTATVGIIFIGFLYAWWIGLEKPKKKDE